MDHVWINFEKTIKRLNIPFIIKHVFKELDSEITFTNVKKVIAKEKLLLNNKYIKSCLIKLLKDKNYPIKRLKKVTNSLNLLYLIENSKKRNWHTFNLDTRFNKSSDILLDRLTNIYGQNVHLKSANNFLWISIEVSPKYYLYLIYPPGEKFFFCSRNKLGKETEKIEKIFQCKNIKEINLYGHDISSLVFILKSKLTNSFNKNLINNNTILNTKPTLKGKSFVSFNQSEKRKKQADSIFGKTPPILQSFSFKASTPREQISSSSHKSGIQLSIKFTSKNVFNTMKKCIEFKILNPSANSFINEIPKCGKNSIYLQQEG